MYAEPVRYVEGLPRPGRCLVMGVLNVTPDSFSDGGSWLDPADAVTHALALLAGGADLIDVGGESTRPGSERVSAAEELARVLPVVEALVDADAIVSVDTTRAEVAAQAVDAGARLVNDVSGGDADPEMLAFVAAAGVPYICMHRRGDAADMDARATYRDVVAEVAAELSDKAQRALQAGIAPGRLAIDPGLGFAKLGDDNWRLLAHLDSLHALGHPVLIGASRKRFLGAALADADGSDRPMPERDAATAAVSALAARSGAWAVRVHDAASSRDAVTVAARWARAAGTQPGEPAGTHRRAGRADHLVLRGITAFGRHGVLESERHSGQLFRVDVVLDVDAADAAASDELSATLDYAEVAQAVKADVESEPVNLLETLAHRLGDLCLRWPAVQRVEVTVHKPEAPMPVPFEDVSMTVIRSRP